MTSPNIDPTWIATNDQLRDCCHRLREAKYIAVDTEFMRSTTFYPKAALVQMFAGEAGGGKCYLVDPLPITDFAPLVELFTDPGVTKIFHSCSEDLEVFNTFLACVPAPLVDTQIAAGLLEYGTSTSYAALVEAVLGVTLDKGETRSDWLQRPLQPKQLEYAVQDVANLLPLYDALVGELEQLARLAWLHEDCELLVANAKAPQDLHAFYPRIKSAWKLNRQQLAVLRQLSHWREQTARERDLPRNHVLHERVVWALAKQQPQSLEALRSVAGMEARKARQFGEALLDLIETSRLLEATDHPPALPPPLPSPQRDLMKSLKETVEARAQSLQVFPEALAKKADYDFIVRSGMGGDAYRLPERMLGWRRTVVGESLLQVAADLAQKSLDEKRAQNLEAQ